MEKIYECMKGMLVDRVTELVYGRSGNLANYRFRLDGKEFIITVEEVK